MYRRDWRDISFGRDLGNRETSMANLGAPIWGPIELEALLSRTCGDCFAMIDGSICSINPASSDDHVCCYWSRLLNSELKRN